MNACRTPELLRVSRIFFVLFFDIKLRSLYSFTLTHSMSFTPFAHSFTPLIHSSQYHSLINWLTLPLLSFTHPSIINFNLSFFHSFHSLFFHPTFTPYDHSFTSFNHSFSILHSLHMLILSLLLYSTFTPYAHSYTNFIHSSFILYSLHTIILSLLSITPSLFP